MRDRLGSRGVEHFLVDEHRRRTLLVGDGVTSVLGGVLAGMASARTKGRLEGVLW
jgi:hypothetical protein